MARFSGVIGYGLSQEIEPGVYDYSIVKRPYFGDINNISIQNDDRSTIVGNIQLRSEISIVADQYLIENASHIKFVQHLGSYWSVSEIRLQHPRIVLRLGEVYNGPTD